MMFKEERTSCLSDMRTFLILPLRLSIVTGLSLFFEFPHD
jgi:hypothetical protein